ncbi:MAG: ABC transporter permease [Oligoflexia bacterium]|nr:ABC transporter permease [Oligoflexia bacterium]
MFLKIILKMAVRNLLRNKRRSIAIVTTIGLGVCALFLYQGFNTGVMGTYKFNTIRSRYGHGQINTKDYRNKVYEKPWEHWIDNYSDVERELLSDSRIQYIFPRVEFYAMITNRKINVTARGQGVIAENESRFFSALHLTNGENLSTQPDGLLIGYGLARALDVKAGSRVTVMATTIFGSLNAIDFDVVGVFRSGTQEFDNTIFRIPLKQAHILLDTNKIESVSLGLKDDDYWEDVINDFMPKFKNLEATSFAVLDKVFYQNGTDFLRAQFNVVRIIILSIVILGIFNTISTSIFERKQEIGNLRANGESTRDIIYLLVTEGMVIGAVSAIIGLLLAVFIVKFILFNGIIMPASPGFTHDFRVPITLMPFDALETFLLGTLAATVGTYFAALKVNKTTIAKLLRSY